MPSTFQALAATVVALLPGSLYVWSFERLAGRWGIGLSDRLLRFVGGSVIFHAALAPASYWFWSTQWQQVVDGEALSWWLWPATTLYVAIPLMCGTVVGTGTLRQARWARWFSGPDPAPRAWDHVFRRDTDGWVRMRLKSGTWLGGAFGLGADGLRSYAAGYPEIQDIYIATVVDTDPVTGEFRRDPMGDVIVLDGGILVRWDEVEYLQFIPS